MFTVTITITITIAVLYDFKHAGMCYHVAAAQCSVRAWRVESTRLPRVARDRILLSDGVGIHIEAGACH